MQSIIFLQGPKMSARDKAVVECNNGSHKVIRNGKTITGINYCHECGASLRPEQGQGEVELETPVL